MALAELIDGRIVIQSEWSEKDLVKQIPGSEWNGRTKLWELPLSWGSCITLRGVFGPQVQIGPELNNWAWQERHRRIEPALALRGLYAPEHLVQAAALTGMPYNPGENDHIERLYPFQLIGREFLAIAGDALLGDEMGCIYGDAVLTVNRGGKSRNIHLRDLVHRFNGGIPPSGARWNLSIPTFVQREVDGVVRLTRVVSAWSSGIKTTFTVTTETGRSIRATDEHPFLTERGWLRLDQLMPGDLVHVRGDADLNVLPKVVHERVMSIEEFGTEQTYDIEVADYPHNFLADGFVVHNTGKTVQVLSALRRLLEITGESSLPALVVCPNGVQDHWADRTREWLPEAVPYPVVGNAIVRRKTLAKAIKDECALVIVNIEAVRLLSRLAGYGSIALKSCRSCQPEFGDENLATSRCETHPKELNEFPFRTCILDEAHRVRDPKAKQTRAIWYTFQQPTVRRRWALTGTPVDSHLGELWSTMRAIDKAEFPVKSKFVNRYAKLSWNAFGGMEIAGLRLDTRQELFQILDPRFRRMTKSVVLPQLPPKVRIAHRVGMTPKQRKAYDEVESSLVTRLDDGTLLIAKSDLAARTRLLQLSSSYCTVVRDPADPDNPRKWLVELAEPCPKLDTLLELLDDLKVLEVGGPSVVVAAEQRKLLELVSAGLERNRIDHVVNTGATPEALRGDNLRLFQSGQVPVLLFTYKAGGIGVDMTRASVMVRLQRSWSVIDNRQGEDRVHRIGSEQHNCVTIVDLITTGTIEDTQMKRLTGKLQRLEEINRDRQLAAAAGLGTEDLDREEVILMHSDLGAEE